MKNTQSSIEENRKANEAYVQNLDGDTLDRVWKSIFRYYEDGRQEMTERKWDGVSYHGRNAIIKMEAEAIIEHDEREAKIKAEADKHEPYGDGYDFDGPAPF